MLIPTVAAFLLFLICFSYFPASVSSRCIVTFSEKGSGFGVQNITFNNVRYCQYLGVRYATAERFEDPVLYQPKQLEQYRQEGSCCPQINEFYQPRSISGDEDCLFLNVYAPKVDKKAGFSGYPVLVFIHGGSFQIGSASFEFDGVDFLVEKQIIVVSINYRLDVLGFFHYPPFNITGNYGLKDQQAALKWINRYIEFFGGDPAKITLMGQSAGAASVTYHLYSKQSRGLFHQGAILSGSFLAPWAYTYRPEFFARFYLRELGITSRQQLLELNATDFFRLDYSPGTFYFNRYHTWPLPTREADDDPNPFFTASPQELSIWKQAIDIFLLVGLTLLEFEQIRFVKFVENQSFNFPNRWNQKVWDEIQQFTRLNAQKFEELGLVSNDTDFAYKMSNSINVNFPLEHALDQMITKGQSAPIFAYRFDFDGKFGLYKNDRSSGILYQPQYGAIHGDDLGYIFNPYCLRKALDMKSYFQKEWTVHDRMTDMVANFVEHGNPSLPEFDWKPYNAEPGQKNIAVIDESLKMKSGGFLEPHFYSVCRAIYDCVYYFNCTEIYTES